MMHKILVTGGAGFIGSNFVRYILKEIKDVRIVILDKLTYAGNINNISEVLSSDKCSFIQADICDASIVNQVMEGCTCVVNFAAETHVDRSIQDPAPFVSTNVEGTLVLLEAARRCNVTRFIQISTDEVYGNAQSTDGTSRPSLETDILRPCSPYAASKTGAEHLVLSYWITYGVPVVVTRCSNNYGPYQNIEKQLPLFITRALANLQLPIYGDGSNIRDWIHVDDHCSAIMTILLASEESVVGEIFNIGANQERTILDNAHLVLKLLRRSESLITFVPDRLGHVRRHAVSTAKIFDRLHWEPKISFEWGIAETIKWYKNMPDLYPIGV